jgi:hypothetical protein
MPRRAAGWTATCAVLWAAGRVPGLLLGAALIAWDAVRPPTPRHLLAAAAGLLGLVPVAVLLVGLPEADEISPLLVARDRAAHLLAGAGLALLVVGVLRDVRADARRDRHAGRPSTPAPPDDLDPGS